eukprot:14493_2
MQTYLHPSGRHRPSLWGYRHVGTFPVKFFQRPHPCFLVLRESLSRVGFVRRNPREFLQDEHRAPSPGAHRIRGRNRDISRLTNFPSLLMLLRLFVRCTYRRTTRAPSTRSLHQALSGSNQTMKGSCKRIHAQLLIRDARHYRTILPSPFFSFRQMLYSWGLNKGTPSCSKLPHVC